MDRGAPQRFEPSTNASAIRATIRSLLLRPSARDLGEAVLFLLLFTLALPPQLLLAASAPAADSHLFEPLPRQTAVPREPPRRLREKATGADSPEIEPELPRALKVLGPRPAARIGAERPESPLVQVTAALRSLPRSNAHLAMFMHVFERYVEGARNPSSFEKRIFDRLAKSKLLTKERLAEVVDVWKQTPEKLRHRLTPQTLRRLRPDQPLRPLEVLPSLVQGASSGPGAKSPATPVDHVLEGVSDPRLRQLLLSFEDVGEDPALAAELARTLLPPSIVQAFPLDDGKTTFQPGGAEPVAAKAIEKFGHLKALGVAEASPTTSNVNRSTLERGSSKLTSPSATSELGAILDLPKNVGESPKGVASEVGHVEPKSKILSTGIALATLRPKVSIMLGRHFVVQRTYGLEGLENVRVEFLPANQKTTIDIDPRFPDRPVGLDDVVWNVRSKLPMKSMADKTYPVFEAPPLPFWGSGAFQPKANELRPDREYLMRVCSSSLSMPRIASKLLSPNPKGAAVTHDLSKPIVPGGNLVVEHSKESSSAIGAHSNVPLTSPEKAETCSPMIPVTILLSAEDMKKVQAEKEAWEAYLETLQRPVLVSEEVYPGDTMEASLGAESFSKATISLINTHLGPHAGPIPASLEHQKNEFGAYTHSLVRLEVPPVLPSAEYIVVVELEGTEGGKNVSKTRVLGSPITIHPFSYRVDVERFRVHSTQGGSPDDFMSYFGVNRDGHRHTRRSGVYHDVAPGKSGPRSYDYAAKDRYVLWNPDEGKTLKTDYPQYEPKSPGAPEVWRPVRHFLSVAVTNWEWDEGNHESQAVIDKMNEAMDEVGALLEEALQEYVESLLESIFGASAFDFAVQFMTIVAEKGWEAGIQWLLAKGTAAATKVAADVQAALTVLAGISEAVWVVSAMVLYVMVVIVVLYALEGSAPDPIGGDLFYVTASELQLLTAKKDFLSSQQGATFHTDEEVVWCEDEGADHPLTANFCTGGDGEIDPVDFERILASPNPDFSEYEIDFRIRGGKRQCVKDKVMWKTNEPGMCRMFTTCDPMSVMLSRKAGSPIEAWNWRTGPCSEGTYLDP